MIPKRFILEYGLILAMTFGIIAFLPHPVTFVPCVIDMELGYLVGRVETLLNRAVRTRGIVKYLGSYYMYEDFWLVAYKPPGGSIPVTVRFTGLPKPNENTTVEITGTIEYATLEGGFYYLNATAINPL